MMECNNAAIVFIKCILTLAGFEFNWVSSLDMKQKPVGS